MKTTIKIIILLIVLFSEKAFSQNKSNLQITLVDYQKEAKYSFNATAFKFDSTGFFVSDSEWATAQKIISGNLSSPDFIVFTKGKDTLKVELMFCLSSFVAISSYINYGCNSNGHHDIHFMGDKSIIAYREIIK